MTIWSDFRFAGRQVRKSPAFSLTVVITLALCIGINTAVYSIVDALFFRSLPYPNPERLFMLTTYTFKGGAFTVDTSQDGSQWEVIRDHASLLDSAVFGSANGVNLAAGKRVEYIQNQRVSANYFHVLGIAPLIGREFTRAEDVLNGPPLAILSYGLYQRVFHADPSVVGKSIDLRGAPYTVVGIAPPGFRTLPAGVGSSVAPDVWTPLRPSPSGEGSGDNYGIIARLKPGVSINQVNGQLNSITREMLSRRRFPPGISIEERAIPLQAGMTYDLRTHVYLMWSAVLLVLVIGCVNIAGMLLTRSGARSREFATRLALGASRLQLMGELLTEAFLLALMGGLLGLALGQFALDGLLRLNPGEFTLTGPVSLDWRVMAVMLAVSLGTSIFFGLAPAFEASAVDPGSVLSETGRGMAGSRRQWKRQFLVFAEVALGVVLVVSAGLLIRTFAKIAGAGPGFDPKHLVVASASLEDARYATSAAGARLFRDSLQQIRQIPGVQSAAVALTSPYGRPLNEGFSRLNGKPSDGITEFTYATPGLFETLRMKLLRGRAFTAADTASTGKVAVANLAFVQRYLRKQSDPLGTSIRIENSDWQIVGIVNNVQEKNGIGEGGPIDQFPEIYVPVNQFPDGIFAMANTWFSPVWIVRTYGDAPALPQALQRALASVDPRLPFSGFQTISDVRGAAMQPQRYQATIFSVLAGLAMLLAALGIYGLIAQSVLQRTREVGIRLALGATTSSVIRTAALPGITLSLAGIALGILLSLFATRLMRSLIWGVAPSDPSTFFAVALLLAVIATLASVLPALRLVRIDPAQALRNE